MMREKDINLEVTGMGMILYSDHAVVKIKKGDNFFADSYSTVEDVLKEVNSGKIVGICLETPGQYIIKVREGFPSDELIDNSKFKLRLSIEVDEQNRIYVRNLDDLSDWEAACDSSQIVDVEKGYYTVLLLSNMPNIGYFGDEQEIYMYLERDDVFITPHFKGIPNLRNAGRRVNLPLV